MMPNALIIIPERMLLAMRAHLFPPGVTVEQGGFLLCEVPVEDAPFRFSALEWLPLQREDYVVQATDYLELTDQARVRIIKLAHARNAALVEVHCHPGKHPACFSLADIVGLAEFVPHIRWRLKGKPYAALVFAQTTVDGLAWFGTSRLAVPIEIIVSDSQRLGTTGLTRKFYGEVRHE
ncbi:MAG: hypothetical protein ACJ8LG_01045 [Massilia sp.]